MKRQNVILERSYSFALEMMHLSRELRAKHEYEMTRQLWRSGTSIGANVEEAQAAQSRADFASKMSIPSKEARETCYWLRLTRDGELLDSETAQSALGESEEILKILGPARRTPSLTFNIRHLPFII